MPNYTCQKCARKFTRKSGYDDHINKKNDCAPSSSVDEIIEAKVKEAVRTITKPEITKETLPGFFERLHNLLRNAAGSDPMRALENMTFFFAYRLIEIQADALSLPQECRWSYLASHTNEHVTFETMKKGCASFLKNKVTKPFFKKPEIHNTDAVYDIVRHINGISISVLQDTDALGDIFEYMLARGMSAMQEEGQYFTNRIICKLAFKISYGIKKTLRRTDGSICTFADWFCGTGGFPAEYIKGVNATLGAVDWKKECNSIYCQDMSSSSVTTTLLNMLILTGVPFSSDNIRSSNSFNDPITRGPSAPFKNLTVDYCFMNPPYGGDTKGEFGFAYSKKVKDEAGKKTTKFLVNSEIQSIGIEDNVKANAGVQLAMATMSSDGGVCCIVLPQGFFFGAGKKYVELRKKLSEEYKIHYVVDIASGSFLNTSTKTSMMVFQKGVGPTENVKFIGLDEKLLVEATLDDLRSKSYSLNYKQYLPQSAVEVEGFEMVKLKDIVSFKIEKSKKDKSSYSYIDIGSVDKGSLKLGETISKDDLPGRAQYSVQIGDVLLGTVRPNLEHYLIITPQIYSDNLIASNGFSIMRCEDTKILPRYLYSILTLPSTTEYLTTRATGTTYPVIDDTIIGGMEIPLPSLERQHEIVQAIDIWTNLAHQEEITLKMLEQQMMFEVKEMGRGKPRVKLGDVCEIRSGRSLTKEHLTGGDIPVIGGGISPMGYHNIHNREPYIAVVAQVGSAGNISRYPVKSWITNNGMTIHPKESGITNDLLYFALKNIQDEVKGLAEGTAQPKLSSSSVLSLTINLPTLAEQQTLQSHFDEIRHKHAKISDYKAKAREAITKLIPGAQ